MATSKDLTSIKSTISTAGIWTPINASDPVTHWGISPANVFYSQIILPNGNVGLVLNAWAYNGWKNTTHYDVSASILEENSDGTMTVATNKWLPDAVNHGSGSVLVADFNRDGKQDIFLAAHNESPFVPLSSTAYISNAGGGYTKISLTDSIEAHGAAIYNYNGLPTVFVGSYGGDKNPYYQYVNGKFVQTTNNSMWTWTSGDSVAVADFNGDGVVDSVFADCNYGPGYQDWQHNQQLIVIYKLSDAENGIGSPEVILSPYFNSRPQYANISSINGLGQAHTYRVWVDDFNHDGKPDIIAGESMWSATDAAQNLSILQMLQNTSTNGLMTFVDKTDGLNSEYSVNTAEVDYSLQITDIDKSGINTYLMAGSLTAYSDAIQNNYILLNDGTGKLHVYMHDQFQLIGDQINLYLKLQGINNKSQPRFIEYTKPGGNINLLAELDINMAVNGSNIVKQALINVPLQLNPGIDYKSSLIIDDRNNSMLMRTWAGNDTFYDTNANSAAAHLDGGLGTDTSSYGLDSSSYHITRNSDTSVNVIGGNISDTLVNVERLQFSDKTVALDIKGTAGQAYRIYQAAFNRTPDNGGLKYWIGLTDGGISLPTVSSAFIASAEFKALYGSNPTNELFVSKLYDNVLHRAPDQGGYDYWVGLLKTNKIDSISTLINFSESAENQAGVIGVIQNGIDLLN